MTTVVARRPTSTVSNYNMGIFGGSASLHAAMADTDDTTYARLFNPADGTWRVRVGFATATITANEYVARYRIRMRIAYDNPGIPSIPIVANWKAYLIGSDNFTFLTTPDHYTSVFYGDQNPFTIYGAWKQPTSPAPRAWTSADLVTPKVELIGFTANDNFFPRIMGIWLEHEVRTRPTTTVSAPTGSQTITTQPSTVFTYDSIDGVPISGYQVKTFTAAQYGAGGFDPETSVSTDDTGVVRPASGTVPAGVKPTAPLTNGVTYKTYTQVRNAGTFSSFYTPKSDWVASPVFSLNVNDPAVPTIASVLNTPRAQIDVTVQGTQNMLTYEAASFEVTTGGWVNTTNCTLARVTSKSADGVASLRITATAGGDTVATSPSVPVVAGQVYSARVQATANATTRSVRLAIDWYNASSVLISSSTGTAVAETGTTFPGITPVVTSATAPALAVTAKLTVTVLAPLAAEVHYIDKVGLKPLADVTWTRGGLADSQTVNIWRSLNAGPFELIKTVALSQSTQRVLLEDGSVPNGVTASYKAKATSIDSNFPTDPLSSLETSATSPLSLYATDWWLRDLDTPLDSIIVQVLQESWMYKEHEEMAEYKAIGRSKPIIVSDVINGIEAPLKLDFLSRASLNAFKLLRGKQKTLLLKSPLVANEQWYIRIRSDVEYELYPNGASDVYCTAKMEIVEQDVPTS